MELSALAEHAFERAKEISKRGDSIMPVFILESAEGKLIIAGMPQYAANRFLAMLMMRQLVEEHDAERYVFVMEAWIGEFKTSEDPRKNDPNYLPSRDPNRKEAVVVVGYEIGGQRLVRMVDIKRHGKKVSFGEVITDDSGRFVGVLDDLFPHAGKPN